VSILLNLQFPIFNFQFKTRKNLEGKNTKEIGNWKWKIDNPFIPPQKPFAFLQSPVSHQRGFCFRKREFPPAQFLKFGFG